MSALLREITGAITGDRRTEAKGRAEERAATEDAPATRASVAEQLEEVREEHGDVPLRGEDDGPPR